MEEYKKKLKELDAEIIKTELMCFIDDDGTDLTVDEFIDYIFEDLSRGDCEIDN